MDIAIVTGAETPLGLRIIERLIQQGCRVHGIGNNFANVTFAAPHFVAHAVDLTDVDAIRGTTEQILEEEKRLHILIHAIDVTPGTAFRKLPLGNLEAILRIGLLGPVMLTRMALPNLLRFRGQLINIIPSNKSGNPASAINALIEGGLREMNNALFDQARDAGLRVTNLILRQNTELPASDVSDDILAQTRIDPEDVAHTVERLLDAHATNVPNEISLHPRLSADALESLPGAPLPLDPYNAIILPPKEYCPPEPEPIPTKKSDSIERVIPYSDDEMEEKIAAAIEDFEAHPERYEENIRGGAQKNEDNQDSGKKKRRRRGGRNRNKNREDKGEGEDSEQSEQAQSESTQAPKESVAAEPKDQARDGERPKRRRGGRNRNRERKPRTDEEGNESTSKSVDQEERSNRRRNQRQKPEAENRQPIATPEPNSESQQKASAEKPAAKKAKKSSSPKTEQLELVSEAKPVKKKAAKKTAAKKAVKKTAAKKAVKKTTAKKAAKKVAKKKTATKKATKKTVAKPSEPAE